MTLLEAANTSSEELEEGPILNRIANKAMGALGDKRAQGRVQRDQLAKQMQDGFSVWIGKTSRKGTSQDVQEYLQKIGFTPEQTTEIVGQDGIGSAGKDAKTDRKEPTLDPVKSPDAEATPDDSTAQAKPGTAPASAPADAGATAPAAPEAQPKGGSVDLQKAKVDQRSALDLAQHHAKLRDQNIEKANSYKHPDAKKHPMARANHHHERYQHYSNEYKNHSDTISKHEGSGSAGGAAQAAESFVKKGRKLLELQDGNAIALRGKEISNIFSAAAAYAHDKNIVTNNVARLTGVPASRNIPANNAGSTSDNSGGFGGYSQREPAASNYSAASQPRGSASTNQAQSSGLANKVMDHVLKDGLTQKAISELRASVQAAKSYSQVADDAKEALGQVGFAFFKVL